MHRDHVLRPGFFRARRAYFVLQAALRFANARPFPVPGQEFPAPLPVHFGDFHGDFLIMGIFSTAPRYATGKRRFQFPAAWNNIVASLVMRRRPRAFPTGVFTMSRTFSRLRIPLSLCALLCLAACAGPVTAPPQ